jgi:quercetin dioxygenase-like cupin family protein
VQVTQHALQFVAKGSAVLTFVVIAFAAPTPAQEMPAEYVRIVRTGCLGLVLAGTALRVSPGRAQSSEEVKPVFEHAIPNIDGKRMVALVVTYPPGGKSTPHHHAGSAFIYAHVLSGAIRSQVDDEPAKVFQVGEGFYEVPGSHHRISENASDRNPASLLAVFIVDSKDTPLTIPDNK